ncbi:hypothetical protein DFH94DRAFT_55799 [Russula ochroleuca]|uniref:RING-type domain-containing protein n=1 Tax=Russula ochroleuca TaxID=152965 RepID=A0A9P5MTG2_9AGAM|nr:hypothetical protein DFH94DRAFT_55799 [Russula ochroleuca]
MSNISSSSPTDLDIWEFVTCSKCHLPFSPGPSAPPQVPFWLTECGHVICNLHLNADQSCCECGAQRIQMIPLQRELDPPMSDWFCSVPHAMDTLSYSMKFQQDMLTSLIRFLRKKIAQQREALLRLKHENEELKSLRKITEQLRAENEQLRLYAGLDGSGSNSATISSGKRRRMDAYNTDGRNLSSPRSVTTPLGPNRLTLPADHRPPVLGQRLSNTPATNPKDPLQGGRPLSSRLRQFAYDPSHTSQQSGASEPQQGTSYQQQTRAMLPPPTPVAHGKASGSFPSVGAIGGRSPYARGQLPPGDVGQQLPPDNTFISTAAHRTAPPAPNHFTPRASTSHMPSGVNSHFVPQTADSRRFVPQTPDTRRFAPAGTATGPRVHSRAGNPNPAVHNGQRGPFYPGTRMG